MEKATCLECDSEARVRGYCQPHYAKHWRKGDLPPRVTVPVADRFWRKVHRGAPDDCWEWLGSCGKGGYGKFDFMVKKVTTHTLAHRFAYELETGPIPAGLQLDHVCHSRDLGCAGGSKCPHRRCVNPAHLEPVTPKVNTNRGRGGGWELMTRCPRGHLFDKENTIRTKSGRACRQCRRVTELRHYYRNREKIKAAEAERARKYRATKKAAQAAS